MFDSRTVKDARSKLQAAVDAVARELGCEIKVGNASYARDGSNCVFKVELAAIGQDGVAQTQEVKAFATYAMRFGLSPDDFGAEFSHRGSRFRVRGIKPKSTRYPVLAERLSDGKTFKFEAELVKSLLPAAAGGS